jgi:hypothetical protein
MPGSFIGNSGLDEEDAMRLFSLGALSIAMLTLAACGQSTATGPGNAAGAPVGATPSQQPAAAPPPIERGSDGGGSGY